MKPFLPASILATLLAGCAQQPPQPAPSASAGTPTVLAQPLPTQPAAPQPEVVQAALPPPVTGPINGYYQGSSQQVDAKIPACPLPNRGLIEIGDRTLLYPYTYQLIYVAPIQEDGTIHAVIDETTLDGHLIDGRLTFSVTTPECQSSFDFKRLRGF